MAACDFCLGDLDRIGRFYRGVEAAICVGCVASLRRSIASVAAVVRERRSLQEDEVPRDVVSDRLRSLELQIPQDAREFIGSRNWSMPRHPAATSRVPAATRCNLCGVDYRERSGRLCTMSQTEDSRTVCGECVELAAQRIVTDAPS